MASPDSIVPDPSNPQSYNRFSYVLNNPLQYTDPSGHCPVGPNGERLCPKKPARKPLILKEWEVRLIVLVASFEGGSQSPQQVRYITWIILNRHNGVSGRTENVLLSDKLQFHATYGNPIKDENKQLTGEYEGGIFTWYEERGIIGPERANMAYDFYFTSAKYSSKANSINEEAARSTIDAYNSGAEDPTQGAIFFRHTETAGQGSSEVAWLRQEATNNNEIGQLTVGYLPGPTKDLVYNNLYSPPFGSSPPGNIPKSRLNLEQKLMRVILP